MDLLSCDQVVDVLQVVREGEVCCVPVDEETLCGVEYYVVRGVHEAFHLIRHDGRQNPWAFHDVDCALEHFLDHVDP